MKHISHTPGPWHLEGQLIDSGIGSCNVMAGKVAITRTLYNAGDAQLIAAAPQMLQALKKALESLNYAQMTLQTPDGCQFNDVIELVGNAISLAQLVKE